MALVGDLASGPDGSLAKAAGTLFEAPREEARGAAKAFVQLLVPFARRGLIEGVMDPILVTYLQARHCRT